MNSPTGKNVDVSEPRLLAAAATGDREARRALFETYREAAYQVAFRVTGRQEDALDVVQDAFIKAFDGLAEFQQESGFKTWLLRIATNRALDLLRARKVRLAISLDRDDDENSPQPSDVRTKAGPSAALEQRELAERLQAAVETLPPEQRSVFALFASGDMTYGQIAEVLGIPIGTVMSRLYHARRRLHEQLADLAPAGAKDANNAAEKP